MTEGAQIANVYRHLRLNALPSRSPIKKPQSLVYVLNFALICIILAVFLDNFALQPTQSLWEHFGQQTLSSARFRCVFFERKCFLIHFWKSNSGL